MGSLQQSRQGLPFGVVLTAIKQRLGTIQPLFPDFVRVVNVPDDKIPEYVAQAGILVRIRGPEPDHPSSGAGRYAYRCTRDFDTILLTENLTDMAGTTENAVREHMLLEESVINVLTLDPPPQTLYDTPIGFVIHWVPGPDEDIVRYIPHDVGMIYSSLSFRVSYVAPMQVFRD